MTGLVLVREDRTSFWTAHFQKAGFTKFEAFECVRPGRRAGVTAPGADGVVLWVACYFSQWYRFSNMLRSMELTSFLIAAVTNFCMCVCALQSSGFRVFCSHLSLLFCVAWCVQPRELRHRLPAVLGGNPHRLRLDWPHCVLFFTMSCHLCVQRRQARLRMNLM